MFLQSCLPSLLKLITESKEQRRTSIDVKTAKILKASYLNIVG